MDLIDPFLNFGLFKDEESRLDRSHHQMIYYYH